MPLSPATTLRVVRLVHTLIRALFAGAILAIPVVAWLRRFDLFLGLSTLGLLDVAALAANRTRCPLTARAARHGPA